MMDENYHVRVYVSDCSSAGVRNESLDFTRQTVFDHEGGGAFCVDKFRSNATRYSYDDNESDALPVVPPRPPLVVSVAQLVARRTHDRKVVGSIPTNAVCFTVVR